MLNPAEQKWFTSHLFKIENEKKEFSSFQCFERTLYTKLPSLNFKALLSSERHIQLLGKKKKKRKKEGNKRSKGKNTEHLKQHWSKYPRVAFLIFLEENIPRACDAFVAVQVFGQIVVNLKPSKDAEAKRLKEEKDKEIQSGKNRGKKKINERTNTNKKYNTTRTHDQVHLEKTEVRY